MPEGKKNSRTKAAKDVNLETLGLEMGNKPPQALDFEEAVLGALLIEPGCVDEAMEELTPSCFYDPKHRMIYEAMTALVNEHVALDLLSVSQKLQEQKNLDRPDSGPPAVPAPEVGRSAGGENGRVRH